MDGSGTSAALAPAQPLCLFQLWPCTARASSIVNPEATVPGYNHIAGSQRVRDRFAEPVVALGGQATVVPVAGKLGARGAWASVVEADFRGRSLGRPVAAAEATVRPCG